MIFLYSQNKHPLIPQAHDPQQDLQLASQTKEFRQSYFQTLQEQVDTFSHDYEERTQETIPYAVLRQKLDRSSVIQAANQRRSELQDQLWEQVAEQIGQDRDRLSEAFQTHAAGQTNLALNSSLKIPNHQSKVDIHRMPGGYLQDTDDADFYSGMLYDHGVFLYGQGWLGALNDEMGHTLINHALHQNYAHLVPHKILDMGCSVGHSTLPYAEAFPEAEVWGIDLGAGLLRYANARAAALNISVHFAQDNAENTQFESESFDLVVSHILMHEIPCGARKKVFAESYRLLAPGGVMIHLDSHMFLSPPTPTTRYFRDTEVWVNNEPFLASSKFEDFQRYALEAGFKPENFHISCVPGYYAQQHGNARPGWVAFCAMK